MKIEETALKDVLIITPAIFKDDRGWFAESYSADKLKTFGLGTVFVQDNHIYSEKSGVLRGIHFQNAPYAQAKLLRCTRGKVVDYAVDLRRNSPTCRQWVCVQLSAENHKQMFIPKGFGHAVVSLTEESEIQYKVDAPYNPSYDRAVRWDDPQLNIEWPFKTLILSEKDRSAPFLKDSDCNF